MRTILNKRNVEYIGSKIIKRILEIQGSLWKNSRVDFFIKDTTQETVENKSLIK